MYSWQNIKSSLGATNPQRYFKSAFWLTSSRVASMAVSLLATFYIARTLGPQNFGELSYAQSVIGVLAIFSALTAAIYRDVVNKTRSENILLGTAWTISSFAAVLTTILALCFISVFPHNDLTINVIAILCLAQFFSPFSIITNVFYAKTETKSLAIVNFLIHLFISVMKIGVMLSGGGVLILAVVMVVEQFVAAVAYLGLYIRMHYGSVLKWRFDPSYAKSLVLDSFPLAIIAISSIVSSRVDQIFIKHYLDIKSVGLYSVAVQLSELWQFIPGLVLMSVFPAIVNSKTARGVYRNRIFSLAGILLIYSLLASAFLTLFAPIIIGLIYGEPFVGSVAILQIYSWSIAGMVLSFLVGQFLLTENLRRIQIVSGVFPMILNVILNIYLIPKFGVSGAAFATVISYSLAPLIPFIYGSARKALFLEVKV